MKNKPKIGLALGSGGARGLAHIGVLNILERNGITIHAIAGTSIGALVGAAYAVNPDAAALERRVAKVLRSNSRSNTGLERLARAGRSMHVKPEFLNRMMEFAAKEMFLNTVLMRKALLSEKDLMDSVSPFLTEIDIAETRIPFAAAAVDLVSGNKIVLKQGSLIKAVMASCAVPGFMPPVSWEGMLLVDGAVIDAIPSGSAREEGLEVVIGVDVGGCLCQPPVIEDGIDAMNRASEIMAYYLSTPGRERADVLIEPDVNRIQWTDFLKYEELIYCGEKAAESMMGEIHAV